MERAANNHQRVEEQADTLKFVEYMSHPISILDPTGTRHILRIFSLLGHWGFCNEDATEIIVEAKPSYASARILTRCRLLIAGSLTTGWDVYSPSGEYLESLPSMAFEHAIVLLHEKKHNH